jgi:hypothetical protein
MMIEKIKNQSLPSVLLAMAVIVGAYFNIHTPFFLSFVIFTIIFVIFAYLPIITLRKAFSEKQRAIKIACFTLCVPMVFLVSGVILFTHIDGEPFNIETSNRGPYPVWYINPFTHKCSYRLQKLAPSDVGRYSYWYSLGECSQEEKDSVFQRDYNVFSAIDLSPNAPISIAEQCRQLSFDLKGFSEFGISIDDGSWFFDACKGLAAGTKACKFYQENESWKSYTTLTAEGIFMKERLQHSAVEWGVSPAVFVRLCPNSWMFTDILSVDPNITENGRPKTKSALPDRPWEPSEYTIPKMMEFLQRDFSNCIKGGGVIQNGDVGGGTDQCIGGKRIGRRFNWTGSLRCGDDSRDTHYVIYNGDNDKWDFTINCKNMAECNGTENALCNKDGCKFSQRCLNSK